MKYIVVSSSEWTYPDCDEYKSGGARIDLHAPRNSFATVQVLFSGIGGDAPVSGGIEASDGAAASGGAAVSGSTPVSVAASGRLSELRLAPYELVSVHVEDNPHLPKGEVVNGCPSRWAPFDIYDCIKPLGARVAPKNGAAGLYLSFELPAETPPGVYDGTMDIAIAGEKVSIPTRVTVYKATVPQAESLTIVNNYRRDRTAEYHRVEMNSPGSYRLDGEYLKLLRRLRQNSLYTAGIVATLLADGTYTFDFSEFERYVTEAISLGYRHFRAPSIGQRESWKKPDINVVVGGVKLPAMSYEAYAYLKQFLKKCRKFLADKGWSDIVYLAVSDEPNELNATTFRALCGMLRKLAPELKLTDAVSYVPIHGALDCWIPLNSEYERHRAEFESLRGENDEMWHYTCCGPRYEGYINRFMDYPLLATRYLFWGSYKYNLTGFLHWGCNTYQPGQDPYAQNCPSHTNTDSHTILPPGDTHIVYPGDGAPWMSLRFEASRHSAEDYELLCALSRQNSALADSICASCFKGFNDVEYDINKFEQAKIRLYKAVSEL